MLRARALLHHSQVRHHSRQPCPSIYRIRDPMIRRRCRHDRILIRRRHRWTNRDRIRTRGLESDGPRIPPGWAASLAVEAQLLASRTDRPRAGHNRSRHATFQIDSRSFLLCGRDDEDFRIGIHMEDGSYRTVIMRDDPNLRVGDRVVIDNGRVYRH